MIVFRDVSLVYPNGVHALAARPATATSATCCCPRSARPASSSCSTPRCCCSAPAASARPPPSTWPPPAWARSASSTWTWSTPPTCSARSSTTWTGSASARSTRPRRRSPRINPDVNVVTYDVRLGADNILDIIDGYDVIVDGTDNFPTRYLVNDASLLKRHPGRARVDLPVRGPGHRVQPLRGPVLPLPWCPSRRRPSWPRPAPRPACSACCPGIIGSIQAMEAIKLLLGLGEPLVGRLLAYDALEESFRTFKVHRDPECPACCDPEAGEIVIAEYDELCMPHPVAAPAGAEPAEPRRAERSPALRPGPCGRNLASMAQRRARAPTRASRSSPSTAPATSTGWDPDASWASRAPTPTPGASTRHVPGPAVDHAPVRRLRLGRGHQRALQVPAGRRVRPACRAPSTCPPRWATTPTIPGPRARWARSGWPSTRWPTCASCWPTCPLDKVTTSMTINATGAILLLLYQLVAEEQGVAGRQARRHHPERHPEGVRRPGHLHLPAPAVHAADHRHLLLLRRATCPSWNTISISGYHIREAGSTAVQEIAFTLANGIAYVRGGAGRRPGRRRLRPPAVSFFWNAHNNLFEEVAKYRAARRMWARIMTERFGAKDERSKLLRFHTQTGGSTLTAQQPENNIVRVTVQALAAALGRHPEPAHQRLRRGARAADRHGRPRSPCAPSRSSATSPGVADTVDPLAGSYFVESLTDEVEAGGLGVPRADRRHGRGGGRHRGRLHAGGDRAGRLRLRQGGRRRREGRRRRQPFVDDAPEPTEVFPIDPALQAPPDRRGCAGPGPSGTRPAVDAALADVAAAAAGDGRTCWCP